MQSKEDDVQAKRYAMRACALGTIWHVRARLLAIVWDLLRLCRGGEPTSRSPARAISPWALPATARAESSTEHPQGAPREIALGNLGGTLDGRVVEVRAEKHGLLRVPRAAVLLVALKRAGFTVMNLAHNLSLDYGASAQAETIAALKRAGLRSTGRPDEIAAMREARRGSRSSASRRTPGRRTCSTSRAP